MEGAEGSVNGPEPVPGVTRQAILVGNNWDGTTDIVDPRTFQRLDRINVIPDLKERQAEIAFRPDRIAFFYAIRTLIGEGHDQFNDDVFSSNDGTTIFVSRPSLADVVAIDLRTKAIKWRAPVDGYRSDHMAINAEGTRLLVSASTGNVVHVLDTSSGARVGAFASGDSPHENVFSKDGTRIYHASIGRVYLPVDRPQVINEAAKGGEYFQIVDARINQVLKRIDMGKEMEEAGYPNFSSAVRPMALSPDERYVYFQLSFFHGFVEYDLEQEKVTRIARLPISDAAAKLLPEQYLLDSAHHGLALDPTGAKLCVAGTMSDYGAIVDRRTFTSRTLPVGTKPYWATNSADGRYCYISSSGDDTVAVVSYDSEQIVHKIPVGRHPQRVRNGVVSVQLYPEPQTPAAPGAAGSRPGAGRPGAPRTALRVRTTKARKGALRFRRGRERVACHAAARDQRLLRCRVEVRAGRKLLAAGERYVKGTPRLAVDVRLTKAGRALQRRRTVRATLAATATDTLGRSATATSRVTIRR